SRAREWRSDRDSYRRYLQADLVVARTDVDAASVPNFKRVNYETKPRTVVFATNVIRWQLTITDCSTAPRGAAPRGTIGSNGVPANLRWTSRAGGLNARRLVPVGELPNEANKTFVFNGANYPSHPRVTAQLYLLGRTQKFLGNA